MHLIRTSFKFSILGLGFAVAGCAHPVALSSCPPTVDYSQSQQAEARDELVALPPKPVLSQMLDDYHREREELKACANAK